MAVGPVAAAAPSSLAQINPSRLGCGRSHPRVSGCAVGFAAVAGLCIPEGYFLTKSRRADLDA